MLHFINEVLSTFIEGIVILILYICLGDKRTFIRENKFKSVLFLVFFTVFVYWARAFLLPGMHTVAIFIFLVILLSFITNTNKLASTINIIIVFTMISIILEFIIVALFIYVMKFDLSLLNDPHKKLVFLCVLRPLQLAGSLFLLYSKKNYLRISVKDRWNSFSNLHMFQFFLFCIFTLSLLFATHTKKNIGTYQFLIIIILLLLVILSYYDYKERQRILAQNRKSEAQQEYVKSLEEFVATLRKEKHDYANHLNTLHVICRLNNPDSMERIDTYLNKLTAQVESSYQSFSTGNDYINALLAVKSNFAAQNNISLKVDMGSPISRLNVPDSDLISIFGNIIDNAFDALLSDKDNADKAVNISTCIRDNKYIIRISNNGPEIPEKNKLKIFDSGFSTKSDKKDRGFGLQLVKQNVVNNSGSITVTSSEGETGFDIEFGLAEETEVNMPVSNTLGV